MGEILATPGAVRRLIKAYGFRLKKSLGQNFLVDRNILDKIIRVAELQPSDIVLEIGPGVGGLTQALAEAGASVVAVEIDKNLVAILGEVLADYPQIRVVHGDALQLPLAELLPAGRACRVVANLPYYITSPLLLKLFEEQLPLSMAVVMVQREVAQRIVAKPGSKEYGALSVAIAYHAEAEIVASVSRSVFFPPSERQKPFDSRLPFHSRRRKRQPYLSLLAAYVVVGYSTCGKSILVDAMNRTRKC
jgi:16S rRNA (adenine1518-N6/adenine1519-N6)-dimethyltransferase